MHIQHTKVVKKEAVVNNMICRNTLLSFFLFSNIIVASSRHCPSSSTDSCVANVMDYGAVGDGKTDDSKAFLKAWGDVCNSKKGALVYLVPKGKKFLLKPILFQGPCKSSSIQVEILGKLVAPKHNEWTNCQSTWLYFTNIQGLNINGSGHIDGQGSTWWGNAQTNCNHPTALGFRNCDNLRIHGLKHLNSARNHISIFASKNVDISNVHINAPENSPNTDGIDICASKNVHIHDSFIGTGDDCVAINAGSSYINITNVQCGPGHGISVGSLGANGADESVKEVLVKNCTLIGTTNGARIKTWEGGSGFASNITFEDIIIQDSRNPIIIDQHYGGNLKRPTVNADSDVKVSNVTYRNVHGTSASDIGINLLCSHHMPCTNIMFEKINLVMSVSGKKIKQLCENVEFSDGSNIRFPCKKKKMI